MEQLYPVEVNGFDTLAACSTEQNAYNLAHELNATFGDGTANVGEPFLLNPDHAAAIAALDAQGYPRP
jgi:hypothetical protein